MEVKLHNALQMTFPELELLLNNRITHYGLVLIGLYPHPNLALVKSKTIIKNQLLKIKQRELLLMQKTPIQQFQKTIYMYKKLDFMWNTYKTYLIKKML